MIRIMEHVGQVDGPARPATVAVDLVRRKNVDNVVHRYRVDELADTARATVAPVCAPLAEHDRARVAADSGVGGDWCRICLFIPDRITRPAR